MKDYDMLKFKQLAGDRMAVEAAGFDMRTITEEQALCVIADPIRAARLVRARHGKA